MNTKHSLGFLLTDDGTRVDFTKRLYDKRMETDYHFLELQEVIKTYFMEELGKYADMVTADTLARLIVTVTGSAVFLDVSKTPNKKVGSLYLPLELTNDQKEFFINNKDDLSQFTAECASFDLKYNEEIKQREIVLIDYYQSINEFYKSLSKLK